MASAAKLSASPGVQSKYICHLTAEQRNSLLFQGSREYEQAFGSLLADIRGTFDEEGFVLIRGLFDEDLLQRLCRDGQEVVDTSKTDPNTFTSLQFGPIFWFPEPQNSKSSGQAFREAAISSAIPAFVARILLRVDDKASSLRLLKDAFLAKGKEQSYCGWHVDDVGFWPTDAQSEGINTWIALDDIPAKFGGGLAVSPKSHRADWRHEAYQAIGSTKIFPPEGIEIGSKLFQEVFGKTCSMNTLNPELDRCIERTKEVFDFQKGDCLFCTRWLFHRSIPINAEGLLHYSEPRLDNAFPTLKRYSIRYELGLARTLRGLSLEACALLYPETSGKSLDRICEAKGQFYPQCWPRPSNLAVQEAEIKSLALNELPKVESKRAELMARIKNSYAEK